MTGHSSKLIVNRKSSLSLVEVLFCGRAGLVKRDLYPTLVIARRSALLSVVDQKAATRWHKDQGWQSKLEFPHFRGSPAFCVDQGATAEEIKAGSAIHGPLDELQARDLPFSLPVAPRLR